MCADGITVRRHEYCLYSPFTNRASNGEALASTAAIDE